MRTQICKVKAYNPFRAQPALGPTDANSAPGSIMTYASTFLIIAERKKAQGQKMRLKIGRAHV